MSALESASVICNTEARSKPSIAMTKPRVRCAGEVGPGGASGGEILARTRILLRMGMDMTIASRDLACAEAGESRVVGEV